MKSSTVEQRVLLLGAGGLLGKSIVNRSAGAPGWRLQPPPVAAEAATPVRYIIVALDRAACDITDRASIENAFAAHEPAIVINCAAYTKVDKAELETDAAQAINVTGVANLAAACKAHNAKLVHVSTDFVFDGTASEPYQPNDPTNPQSAYGRTKREGEIQIQSIDPPGWLIVRTAWLFGQLGPCFPLTILSLTGAGKTLSVVTDQIGCPTYAPDLADAMLDLIGAEATGIHHVTNAGSCSWFDFARALVVAKGLPEERIRSATTDEYRAARPNQAVRPMYSVLGDDELPRLIGRSLRPWKETIADYLSV